MGYPGAFPINAPTAGGTSEEELVRARRHDDDRHQRMVLLRRSNVSQPFLHRHVEVEQERDPRRGRSPDRRASWPLHAGMT